MPRKRPTNGDGKGKRDGDNVLDRLLAHAAKNAKSPALREWLTALQSAPTHPHNPPENKP